VIMAVAEVFVDNIKTYIKTTPKKKLSPIFSFS